MNAGELPVFKLTCRADAKPHPFLGREIYTSDPGPRVGHRQVCRHRRNHDGAVSRPGRPGAVLRQRVGEGPDANSWTTMTAASTCGLATQEKEDLVNFLRVL